MMGVDLFRLDPGEVFGEKHVARGGRPAECLPLSGLPAYESESGTVLVMEALIAWDGGVDRAPMLLPTSYRDVALRAPSGLAALHDDVDAVWTWRPIIHSLTLARTQRSGSQQELEWRIGLHQVAVIQSEQEDRIHEVFVRSATEILKHERPKEEVADEYEARVREILAEPSPTLGYDAANRRASAILREHLTPQQRVDLAAEKAFYVRGRINRLYRVEPGNGFQIVGPVSREILVTFCLHPDEWIPADDVALATKLAIDAGEETEAELLSAGRATLRPRPYRVYPELVTARRLEQRFALG